MENKFGLCVGCEHFLMGILDDFVGHGSWFETSWVDFFWEIVEHLNFGVLLLVLDNFSFLQAF